MSVRTQIAEAVKEELNDHTFSQPFTATRQRMPIFDLADMATLRVTVVPKAVEVSPANRLEVQHDVSIDVAVQKKLGSLDNAEIDPLAELVEEIIEFFQMRRLTEYQPAVWTDTKNDRLYVPEHMEEKQLFTSVITLTFSVAV